jgi:hypothetical protein
MWTTLALFRGVVGAAAFLAVFAFDLDFDLDADEEADKTHPCLNT